MYEFISKLLILFHCFMSVFMPVSYSFDYYTSVVQFEIKKCDISTFVPSQDRFGYSEIFVVTQ